MSKIRPLLTAIPVATLALALAACTPPEESPPMDPDQPADVETAPANDPWAQPETDDQLPVDPTEDPWDEPLPPEDGMPPEDQPPQMIDPTMNPTDEQIPPPDPEDGVADPVDP